MKMQKYAAFVQKEQKVSEKNDRKALHNCHYTGKHRGAAHRI